VISDNLIGRNVASSIYVMMTHFAQSSRAWRLWLCACAVHTCAARVLGGHNSDQSRRGQLTLAAECAAERATDIVISFKMEVDVA
jgi:hypothetical protein